MHIIAAIVGLTLVVFVLWDGFETIIFPHRVTRKMRLTRLFYRCTWVPWSKFVVALFKEKRMEILLSFYGPLSLLYLLIIWAGGLVIGFGFLHWAADAGSGSGGEIVGFWKDLYLSGTTFFTLGIGDVTPRTPLGRILTVVEAGLGFGFLALIIGYLPALNQSFARREVNISLLDARAGSPPTALEMLRRHAHEGGAEELRQLLIAWEKWSAELLESHLSYPVLAYFRSQHDNQSWLSAISAVLDASAILITCIEHQYVHQAELTFAMARHALVDIAIVFNVPPWEPDQDRLSSEDFTALTKELAEAGIVLSIGEETEQRLRRLRHMYEPYVSCLARHLSIHVPRFMPTPAHVDNWQVSAWGLILPLEEDASSGERRHRHF